MVYIPTQTFKNLDIEKQNRIIEAAINEFSRTQYENAKLSNIIKEADIPRGSFYQYFKDKKDLFVYLFDLIGKRKMQYMSAELLNPNNLSFFELFRELYRSGMRFAVENPRFVKITSLLMASRGVIFKEVFESNIQIAKDFYKGMILNDQAQGRMDPLIDPDVLADMIIDMTVNVGLVEAMAESGDKIDFELYEKKVEKIIYILEKGITGN